MTLVERFITISDWPDSVKTAVLGSVLVPLLLISWSFVHSFREFSTLGDFALIDRFLAIWAISTAIATIPAVPFALKRQRARWTKYVLLLTYTAFVPGLMQLFGSAGSVYMLMVPLVAVCVVVIYDVRVGWVALGWMTLLLIILSYLEVQGAIPYAPAMVSRSIDAQRNIFWMLGVHVPMLQSVLFVMVVVSLLVSARRLQESRLNLALDRLNEAHRALAAERERSEQLLLNILPASIADRLKASETYIADHCNEVTVLFADMVGFTPLSEQKSPQELVKLLDRVFTEFDSLAEKNGLEKIKTIGDAYMAVAGIPQQCTDHAQRSARMAQDMVSVVARLATETGEPLAVRVGLHSGPVVAGVIGRKKFSYDMWGDTVNTASRMESHGTAGEIQCSETTAALLKPAFGLSARGPVPIKGKGVMNTYFLTHELAP